MNLFKKFLLIFGLIAFSSSVKAGMNCDILFDSGLSSAATKIGQALVDGQMHISRAIESLQKLVAAVDHKQELARVMSGNKNLTYHDWFKYDAWLKCMKNARDLVLDEQTISFMSELGRLVTTYGPVLGLGMVLGVAASYGPELLKKTYNRCINFAKSRSKITPVESVMIVASQS